MKPICVPCQRFYRCTKIGYYFIEGMPIDTHASPGLATPEHWKPYKIWVGDKYTCPDCGAEIVIGVGLNRLAEHYEPDFQEVVKRLGADQLVVKDC